ncbi:MAG: ATP-binding protein [Gammaproteobacteria bacterium]|uniref:Putative ATPase domain containing protein n=1 Tax=viral metagenome TaxID=1070528 RepID=A0A6H1ZB88_9ZZZZ|nr:ATP-binding protein [Gammaproteobacteria bacterium]
MSEDAPTFSIGGVEATPPRAERMSMLLWGQAGVGKTTLASTLPGKLALINFDPDGPASIPDAENVSVFDLSGVANSKAINLMKSENEPFGVSEDMLNYFDGFIVDSLTSIEERTLSHGIKEIKGATLERPSPGAYQARNNVLVSGVRNLLAVTGRAKKHVCLIAHEGGLNTTDEGVALNITVALGGKNPQNIASKINECWNMFEDSKNRKMIIVRKGRMREPLKSRMFDTMEDYEFEWQWNTRDRSDPLNMWIKEWYDEWKEGGFKKLMLPKKRNK